LLPRECKRFANTGPTGFVWGSEAGSSAESRRETWTPRPLAEIWASIVRLRSSSKDQLHSLPNSVLQDAEVGLDDDFAADTASFWVHMDGIRIRQSAQCHNMGFRPTGEPEMHPLVCEVVVDADLSVNVEGVPRPLAVSHLPSRAAHFEEPLLEFVDQALRSVVAAGHATMDELRVRKVTRTSD
jgi:hypothetical protein